MVVCMTSWHAHLKCTESSYEHGEEVLHRAYGAGSGRQNQSNGSHRKANQIGAGDASTARGELIRPKQAAAPNTTAPEIAALVLQRRFIWQGDFRDRFEPDPYCHERNAIFRSWPNTKDQTPYLVIRRCNTSQLRLLLSWPEPSRALGNSAYWAPRITAHRIWLVLPIQ